MKRFKKILGKMKTKNILKEMYVVVFNKDTARDKILWLKAIKKSLKHKKP